jgi:predicted Zn-dependent protease
MKPSRITQISFSAVVLLLLASTPSIAGVKEAENLWRSGEYAKAEAEFRKLRRNRRALLGLARVQLETARHKEAAASARRAAGGKHWAAALTVVGEALRAQGKLPQAEAVLKKVLARRPRHYRAHVQLGLVYLEQGKAAEAKQAFDLFYDDFGAGKIDKSSAEQLTYVAMACRYSDNFRDASDTLADAVKADPRHAEALIEHAEISLEKYEAGWAEKHFESALKINPNHPRALVGLARVKLEQSNDVEAAHKLLARAEKAAPGHIDIAIVRAQILIDAEQSLRAEALLTKALARNPRHLEALSMMAASYFLRDDLGSFKRMRAQVLKLNPRYTAFFRTVVQLAVRHHRYREAIDLGKQAIKIDSQDWYSLADLGQNYLRLGNDKEGIKYLKQAWQGDRFNVRNFNLLNLFDDVVAKEYTFFSSRHFRLRVHKKEQELIKRTVVPLLEEAYALYVRKYRFKPKLPIIVELFRDPQHYAVRTVGTPGLSALGVCFGRVVTASSPTAGRFNWGQVLWHELNHVFTIQLSRSRVPRWLTEGLADLEPILRRAEWKRENDFDIWRAIRGKRLKGIDAMSTAFSRAKDIQEMVVAYYQGSLMVRWMIKEFGLPKVVAALKQYGKGKRTAQILPAVTGVSLAELDRRFQAAERKRLGFYARNWYVDPRDYGDLKVREKAAKAKPKDATVQARLAMAQLVAGKLKLARAQAQKALTIDATQRLALFVRGQVALASRKHDEAARSFKALIAAGGDGYETRLALGKAALRRGKLDLGAKHLAAAKRFDPERSRPHMLLVRAYEKAGKTDKLIEELKHLARLEQQSFSLVAKLVSLLGKRKDHVGLRRFGRMAYYINPASAKLHSLMAEAYAAPAPKPDLRRALWHAETAVLCPDAREPAELHYRLAKLHHKLRQRARARAAIEAALKADPNHAGARKLKKKLGK